MLLIVSIKTMMLHARRFLPSYPLLELQPLTLAGGKICHSQKLLGSAMPHFCDGEADGATKSWRISGWNLPSSGSAASSCLAAEAISPLLESPCSV